MMQVNMCQITSLAAGLSILLSVTACSKEMSMQVKGGDAERGKVAVQRYGCVACHVIPNIPNPGSNVGPPLARIAHRAYIAGVLPNTPDNMIRWLQDPPAVDPRTAMPDMGVTEAQARDMAAYMYTLK
jgi:cytochrome c